MADAPPPQRGQSIFATTASRTYSPSSPSTARSHHSNNNNSNNQSFLPSAHPIKSSHHRKNIFPRRAKPNVWEAPQDMEEKVERDLQGWKDGWQTERRGGERNGTSSGSGRRDPYSLIGMAENPYLKSSIRSNYPDDDPSTSFNNGHNNYNNNNNNSSTSTQTSSSSTQYQQQQQQQQQQPITSDLHSASLLLPLPSSMLISHSTQTEPWSDYSRLQGRERQLNEQLEWYIEKQHQLEIDLEKTTLERNDAYIKCDQIQENLESVKDELQKKVNEYASFPQLKKDTEQQKSQLIKIEAELREKQSDTHALTEKIETQSAELEKYNELRTAHETLQTDWTRLNDLNENHQPTLTKYRDELSTLQTTTTQQQKLIDEYIQQLGMHEQHKKEHDEKRYEMEKMRGEEEKELERLREIERLWKEKNDAAAASLNAAGQTPLEEAQSRVSLLEERTRILQAELQVKEKLILDMMLSSAEYKKQRKAANVKSSACVIM